MKKSVGLRTVLSAMMLAVALLGQAQVWALDDLPQLRMPRLSDVYYPPSSPPATTPEPEPEPEQSAEAEDVVYKFQKGPDENGLEMYHYIAIPRGAYDYYPYIILRWDAAKQDADTGSLTVQGYLYKMNWTLGEERTWTSTWAYPPENDSGVLYELPKNIPNDVRIHVGLEAGGGDSAWYGIVEDETTAHGNVYTLAPKSNDGSLQIAFFAMNRAEEAGNEVLVAWARKAAEDRGGRLVSIQSADKNTQVTDAIRVALGELDDRTDASDIAAGDGDGLFRFVMGLHTDGKWPNGESYTHGTDYANWKFNTHGSAYLDPYIVGIYCAEVMYDRNGGYDSGRWDVCGTNERWLDGFVIEYDVEGEEGESAGEPWAFELAFPDGSKLYGQRQADFPENGDDFQGLNTIANSMNPYMPEILEDLEYKATADDEVIMDSVTLEGDMRYRYRVVWQEETGPATGRHSMVCFAFSSGLSWKNVEEFAGMIELGEYDYNMSVAGLTADLREDDPQLEASYPFLVVYYYHAEPKEETTQPEEGNDSAENIGKTYEEGYEAGKAEMAEAYAALEEEYDALKEKYDALAAKYGEGGVDEAALSRWPSAWPVEGWTAAYEGQTLVLSHSSLPVDFAYDSSFVWHTGLTVGSFQSNYRLDGNRTNIVKQTASGDLLEVLCPSIRVQYMGDGYDLPVAFDTESERWNIDAVIPHVLQYLE